MPGLLIFIGVGVIFATLVRRGIRKAEQQRKQRRRDLDVDTDRKKRRY